MEEEKTTPETQKPDSRPDRSQLNAFENFYENFRKVPLKYIDVFIGVCVAALVIVVLVGILKSKGILKNAGLPQKSSVGGTPFIISLGRGRACPARGLAEGSRSRENRRGGIHPSRAPREAASIPGGSRPSPTNQSGNRCCTADAHLRVS
ncbi:hypothetical protein [Gemmiger sp.]